MLMHARFWIFAGGALLSVACSSGNSSSNNGANSCPVGSEGCPCTVGKGCDQGLVCFDPICFRPDAAGVSGSGGTPGSGGSATGGSGGTATGGSGGSSGTDSGGALLMLDGKACTVATSAPDPQGDWGSYKCRDAYDCGGCLVYLLSPSDASAKGNWYLLGAYSATGGRVQCVSNSSACAGSPSFGG